MAFSSRQILVRIALLISVALFGASAHAGGIEHWTDKDGVVHWENQGSPTQSNQLGGAHNSEPSPKEKHIDNLADVDPVTIHITSFKNPTRPKGILMEVIGTAENISSSYKLKFVEVIAKFKNQRGEVISKRSAYVDDTDIEPNGYSSFSVLAVSNESAVSVGIDVKYRKIESK